MAYNSGSAGKAGGSGVVILRHADTFPTATVVGALVTQTGGNTIYQFLSSGTIIWD
jgi:hypothetical protein